MQFFLCLLLISCYSSQYDFKNYRIHFFYGTYFLMFFANTFIQPSWSLLLFLQYLPKIWRIAYFHFCIALFNPVIAVCSDFISLLVFLVCVLWLSEYLKHFKKIETIKVLHFFLFLSKHMSIARRHIYFLFAWIITEYCFLVLKRLAALWRQN